MKKFYYSFDDISLTKWNVWFLLVLCPPGSYSKDGMLPCLDCPKNFYQSEYGRLRCVPCGGGLETTGLGSRSFKQCSTKGKYKLLSTYNVVWKFINVWIYPFEFTLVSYCWCFGYRKETFEVLVQYLCVQVVSPISKRIRK